MDKYFEKNQEYWDLGYEAENVEGWVFRPYGRVFKHEFGLDGSKHERVLDFGCGSGAALKFFKSKGFDVYGVDISQPDINRCKSRMPDVADHFLVIPPEPSESDVWFGGNFDLVVSIQALYYFTFADYEKRIKSIYNMMKPGAYIYASMMSTKCWYYENSTPYKDGLRNVTIQNGRLNLKDYYIFFLNSEEELLEKFKLFKKIHVGFYSHKYSEKEGLDYHYTYIGQKV